MAVRVFIQPEVHAYWHTGWVLSAYFQFAPEKSWMEKEDMKYFVPFFQLKQWKLTQLIKGGI